MDDTFTQFSDAVYEIWRTIRKMERQEIEQFGLKHGHAQILRTILHSPEGITATKLCAACEKDKAAVSRILAELSDAGLVYRKTERGNHYRAKVCLTEQGSRIVSQVEECSRRLLSQASTDLQERQLQATNETLIVLAENLRKLCDRE